MAYLYVASTGSNTAPYSTWATAATNPSTAVNAAAAGDTVFIHSESFTITVAETWTLAGTSSAPVMVICSNDKVNEPPQTLATGAKYTQTTTVNDFVVQGIGYIYGFTFESTGLSGAAITYTIASTDSDHIELEECGFLLSSTHTSISSALVVGASSSNYNTNVIFKNFSLTFGNRDSQTIVLYGNLEWTGGSVSSTATLTSLLTVAGRSASIEIDGVDMSGLNGTIFNPAAQAEHAEITISNCKLNASSTLCGAFTDVSQGELWSFNCDSSDVHYNFGHYNCRGSVISETGIYCNDGDTYDGTNHITWKIVTTAYANFYTPFISPWVEKYHSGTSAITPYFEILRDGSTTAYQDNQVWGEFSAQTTTGYPLATFSMDRKALLSAAANQAAGVGTSGWTGDTTAWSGKIDSGSSMTPAEIGMLRGRVRVGEPSITVYVDPKIRT